jgi:hypothetical protein
MVERRRNTLVLIMRHLVDAGYVESYERLSAECNVSLQKVGTCIDRCSARAWYCMLENAGYCEQDFNGCKLRGVLQALKWGKQRDTCHYKGGIPSACIKGFSRLPPKQKNYVIKDQIRHCTGRALRSVIGFEI